MKPTPSNTTAAASSGSSNSATTSTAPGSTGPPTCTTAPDSTSGSSIGAASATCVSDGRLSTTPIAPPSSVCSAIRTTVRRKFGSSSDGEATSSRPFSELMHPFVPSTRGNRPHRHLLVRRRGAPEVLLPEGDAHRPRPAPLLLAPLRHRRDRLDLLPAAEPRERREVDVVDTGRLRDPLQGVRTDDASSGASRAGSARAAGRAPDRLARPRRPDAAGGA